MTLTSINAPHCITVWSSGRDITPTLLVDRNSNHWLLLLSLRILFTVTITSIRGGEGTEEEDRNSWERRIGNEGMHEEER